MAAPNHSFFFGSTLSGYWHLCALLQFEDALTLSSCHLPCSQSGRGRKPSLRPYPAPSPTRVARLFWRGRMNCQPGHRLETQHSTDTAGEYRFAGLPTGTYSHPHGKARISIAGSRQAGTHFRSRVVINSH